MINDRIRLFYPISKLSVDTGFTNGADEEKFPLEYIIRSGFDNPPSVVMESEYREENNKNADNRVTVEADIEEIIDFDTCFRIYRALEISEYQISDKIDAVTKNYLTVERFVRYVENVISSANYYIEREVNERQQWNNRIVWSFIRNHSRAWNNNGIANIDDQYNILQELRIDDDRREMLDSMVEQMDQHLRTKGKCPYYLYDKLAAFIDADFKNKRNLLRVFNREHHIINIESDLFVCMALNDEQLRNVIAVEKSNFIEFSENTINGYLEAALGQQDITAIETMRSHLDRESNTDYERRYAWNDRIESTEGKGCVGLLISSKGNRFAFSGYKDVADVSLQRKIPGSGDKLSGLIARIEQAIRCYGFTAEKTNRDERYYNNTTGFSILGNELPLDSNSKIKYQCCEKKLFSHVQALLGAKDDVKVIVTRKVCSIRGCQDLIRQYRNKCNSIRAFYIDTDPGKFKEQIF